MKVGARPGLEQAVGILGTGRPDLPACGPRHGSTSGPVRPIFISKCSRPSQGPGLVRRTTQDLLGGGLTRLAREGRRDQGKGHLARFL